GGYGGQSGLYSADCRSQIPMLIPWAIGCDALTSRAEVFETSALSCGLSLVMSSVKTVAS
ncbi:hypothetical protein, partial [Terracidiphilus sp.]|uniref:hypothetical protein n=1 Tax=Terracidiphilus sp. TaxID=1964191 RepID=UPI003C173575